MFNAPHDECHDFDQTGGWSFRRWNVANLNITARFRPLTSIGGKGREIPRHQTIFEL